jgi:hypothetical protein
MSLLLILLVLIAVGLILWGIEKFLPLDATIKRIIQIVAIVLVVIWLLKELGVFALLASVTI